ncbi:unnamed protein product [Fraxinus pennsylvanica]|uniref:Uncharacterized protein n=1 Tax=Fraxinus pennsylvanica TaxID=56036 RepID=A0AAD1ZJJ3_9LAMI|nr:unnamed protein product [Fraxinus pennsylvanica]
MAQKRKMDITVVDENDKELLTIFLNAASNLSLLYTEAVDQQKTAFEGGQKYSLRAIWKAFGSSTTARARARRIIPRYGWRRGEGGDPEFDALMVRPRMGRRDGGRRDGGRVTGSKGRWAKGRRDCWGVGRRNWDGGGVGRWWDEAGGGELAGRVGLPVQVVEKW